MTCVHAKKKKKILEKHERKRERKDEGKEEGKKLAGKKIKRFSFRV